MIPTIGNLAFFRRFGRAERDIVTLGIAVAAMLLFVSTGGTVLPQVIRSWMGRGEAPDSLLVTALLLNIALIIFGWRRYAELTCEIAERRNAEQEARKLAETDPLTGCLNRRSVEPAIEAMLAEERKHGRSVATLVLDLDNFKRINDLNGHKFGDEVLRETTRRLTAVLPRKALLARLGGDEFACALPFGAASREKVDAIAQALVDAVSRPIRIGEAMIETTVSIGVVADEPNEEPVSGDTLLHRADIAMYQAKATSRNGYCWFDPSLETELQLRGKLENGIRRGIGRGEFVPFYEQQIDLETGKLSGFEMLARWQSPELGLIGPEIFIPIAEEIGLIAELSESVIAQALEDAKEWDPSLTLSVNISPLQLRDPWFAQKLLKMLLDHGFPPNRLDIEITESCLHENIGLVRTIVGSLKNQGIRVSLDDFGTGYSSLAQLRSLPFDRIKIDRSFIGELKNSGSNAKLIEAIISLGRGLELPITAEGIENDEILGALRKMGSMKGQGYLYGRPEDAQATHLRLAENKLLAEKMPEGCQELEPRHPISEPLNAEAARNIAQ